MRWVATVHWMHADGTRGRAHLEASSWRDLSNAVQVLADAYDLVMVSAWPEESDVRVVSAGG